MESDNRNQSTESKSDSIKKRHDDQQNEQQDVAETDKYLALEQDGVTFTDDSHPTNYSDNAENGEQGGDTWNPNGENSRNSEAFNQDDYILNDNIDLDEDQNQSISSDDI